MLRKFLLLTLHLAGVRGWIVDVARSNAWNHARWVKQLMFKHDVMLHGYLSRIAAWCQHWHWSIIVQSHLTFLLDLPPPHDPSTPQDINVCSESKYFRSFLHMDVSTLLMHYPTSTMSCMISIVLVVFVKGIDILRIHMFSPLNFFLRGDNIMSNECLPWFKW